MCKLGIALYESPIEIRKAQKRLNVFYSLWGIPFQHSLNLFLVHFHTFGRNDITKEIDFRLMPFALLGGYRQLVLLKARQHSFY